MIPPQDGTDSGATIAQHAHSFCHPRDKALEEEEEEASAGGEGSKSQALRGTSFIAPQAGITRRFAVLLLPITFQQQGHCLKDNQRYYIIELRA